MNATLLYRIGAIVFILFAIGHTYGFLSFRPDSSEALATYNAMNTFRFQQGGQSFTYGGFYRGFGLSCTVAMLFWSFLCWHLGELARTSPASIGSLGWAFLAVQVAGVVMSFLYFGIPPMVLSTCVTLLVGVAAFLVNRP